MALELASRHPHSLRALVLDSPALGAFERSSIADNGRRAWRALVAECAGNPTCARQHPNLDGELQAALRTLASNPRPVPVPEQFGAPGGTAMLDPADLEIMLFFASYRRQGAAAAPLTIRAATDGPDAALAMGYMGGMTSGALSVFVLGSNYCRDGTAARNAELEKGQTAAVGPQILIIPAADCGAWAATDRFPHIPKDWTVPTIVLSGSLDPITPPDNARYVADALGPAARLIEFRSVGHSVMFQDDCAFGIVMQFIADPKQPLTDTCVASRPPLDFAPQTSLAAGAQSQAAP